MQEPLTANDSEKKEIEKTGVSKRIIKWVILLTILMFLIYSGYRLYSFYIAPNRAVQQTYLIPKDAIFIIQSGNPVSDWKRISESEPWQCLQQSPSFAEITEKAAVLDSILTKNSRLMSFVGERDLMISAHKVRSNHWDFLYIVDLQKLSEVELLKEHIQQAYSLLNFKVTYRKYKDVEIIELTSSKTREILYTAFVDNHYIASYSSKLVQASIDERDNPTLGLDYHFIEISKLVAGKGLFRIYLQYAYLPDFFEIYMGKDDAYLPVVSNSMTFGGLNVEINNDKFELRGHTFFRDTVNPYVSALFHSGKKEMQAHNILSDRTAFYTNIGFDDPATFIKELEKALSANNPSEYATYKSTYKKIESTLDISLTDDFLSWMSGEFAFTELEPGLLGHDPEIILSIKAKDPRLAKEKMAYIERKVKKHTPVNVKAVSYKGYQINYVELKGFFALFFGKIFNKFEKPYYTYIDDYVVLSNRPASLLSFVEDYEQKRTLSNDDGFKLALSQVDKKSTYFVYANTKRIFPILKPLLNKKSWSDLEKNKNTFYSFPYSALQVGGDHKQMTMLLCMNYQRFEEEIIADPVEQEEENDSISNESENHAIDELSRFYAEKFQGNIYREFYQEGYLKSECEIRDGRRHGKYHEYYENGTLKIRGKYSKDRQKGTWLYYSEDGKQVRKEKKT